MYNDVSTNRKYVNQHNSVNWLKLNCGSVQSEFISSKILFPLFKRLPLEAIKPKTAVSHAISR